MDNYLLNKRTGNVRSTQLEMLVSCMESNPNLAIGLKDKEKRKKLWMDLHVQLNAVAGGTQKTLEQWKKTWKDQRAKTHAKAMRLIETGGHSTHLTSLEERILKIMILGNEFKSPEPTSDIFLIPETGIVFSLPRVTQNASQPVISSTPSTSQAAPDTPATSQVAQDNLMSESSGISVLKVLQNVTVSSKEVPLIKEETEEKNPITDTTNSEAEYSLEIAKPLTNHSSKNNSPERITGYSIRSEYTAEFEKSTINCPTSTTAYRIAKAPFQKGYVGHRRRRDHLRSHYMTADKAAETFRFISERNCAVLERIASAIETQASRAAKQTELLREIIDVVKHR